MLNNWVSLRVTVQHTSVWDRFGCPLPWVLWWNGVSAASQWNSKRSPYQFVSSRVEECWLVGHTVLCYFQLYGILMMESQGFHKLMHPDRASARSDFDHFWQKKPYRGPPNRVSEGSCFPGLQWNIQTSRSSIPHWFALSCGRSPEPYSTCDLAGGSTDLKLSEKHWYHQKQNSYFIPCFPHHSSHRSEVR